MSAKYWAAPKPGDIVQCRFPQDAFSEPGPKERAALVTRVEIFDEGVVDVDIAYGTSQHLQSLHAGEFLVPATDNEAGLTKDTKFDLGNIVRLPFNTEWFAPNPTSIDRVVLGVSTQLVSPRQIAKLPSCKALCAFELAMIELDHCHRGSCAEMPLVTLDHLPYPARAV